MYDKLFSPAKIGNCEIKNRVVMTAMGVCVAEPNGVAGKRFSDYYEERAKGGVGLIITEVTRVNKTHGVALPGQLSMTDDSKIEPFSKVVDKVHSHGTKIFVQLHHAGRQNLAAIGTMWHPLEIMGNIFPPMWKMMYFAGSKVEIDMDILNTPLMVWAQNTFLRPDVSASDVVCGEGVSFVKNQPTRPLKIKEIRSLEQEFVDAAVRVKKSGADGVELHASHGYLIQQFLSPYTNRRKDEYGGSLENRMRFLLEIIAGIREACGKDFPLMVRLSVEEFYDAIGMGDVGIKLPEGIEMAKILEKAGVDAINVSCATYETLNHLIEPMSFPQGWRSYLAKAVKDVVSIPVVAVGVIRDPDQAEALLESGNQDFIGLGRPLLADPYWAKKAQEGKAELIQRCIGCVSCFESLEKNATSGEPCECALNPRNCRENKYNDKTIKKGSPRKTVVVVGAGPAGLTAAREAAKRGFKTVLLEKNAQPGGQLILAAAPPHKDKMFWAINDLTANAKAAGVEIKYNCKVTEDILKSYKPYAIILATGGVSVHPRIPGADGDNVCTTTEILNGTVKLENKNVAVIGSGMTGLETSLLLTESGNKITIVEMAKKIAPGLWTQHYHDVVPQLEKAGTKFYPGMKLSKIDKTSITIESEKGKSQAIPCDYVVLSLGVRPVNDLKEAAEKVCKKVVLVGDANKPGRILAATKAGFKAAISI